jgi:hypothetical protein
MDRRIFMGLLAVAMAIPTTGTFTPPVVGQPAPPAITSPRPNDRIVLPLLIRGTAPAASGLR